MGHRQATRYSAGSYKRPVAAGTVAGPAGPTGLAKSSPTAAAKLSPTAAARLRPSLGPAARAAGAPAAGAPKPREPFSAAAASAAVAAFAAVAAGAGLMARWAWKRWQRTEVSGDSMAPALQAGDRLLVWRTKRLKVGDIVAAGDPRRPERTVLKRAASVDAAGVFLVGDNEERSTDSRQFGPVPRHLVRGRAVYRYAPPGRAGRL